MKAFTWFIIGSIALPLLIVLIGIFGFLPSTATSEPPGIENNIAGRALDGSLERRAKGLRNPVSANDINALSMGMSIFSENCAGCHGTANKPSTWGSKGFYPRAPQFWQEDVDVTPEEAYAAIHDGIRYSGMGAWRDLIKDDAMWKVATFVSHIHRLPPELQQKAKATP